LIFTSFTYFANPYVTWGHRVVLSQTCIELPHKVVYYEMFSLLQCKVVQIDEIPPSIPEDPYPFFCAMKGALRRQQEKRQQHEDVSKFIIQSILNDDTIPLEIKARLCLVSKGNATKFSHMLNGKYDETQCSFCQTTENMMNDPALMRAGGYFMPVCTPCFHKFRSVNSVILHTDTELCYVLDAYNNVVAGGDCVSSVSNWNFQAALLKFFKNIVKYELMSDGYEYYLEDMPIFEKVSKTIAGNIVDNIDHYKWSCVKDAKDWIKTGVLAMAPITFALIKSNV